ncbi:MAG: site-specific integrase [Ruminococcaceae bacterium]|nr:site-specific integrase [Oscillospiraceae bacterium]
MATRRQNGRWRAQVYVGTDADGKRKYQTFEADTRDEADYLALTYKLGKGKSVRNNAITLRMAMKACIESKKGILSPTTIRSYESIELNFGDYLDTPLHQVDKIGLQTAINRYMFSSNSGKGVRSSKSVRNAFGFISSVLKQNDINIGDIALPRKQDIEYATPFDAELANIFEAVRGTSIEIPVLLATFCSLRRGEICGLRFSDVDYDRKLIKIERSRLQMGALQVVKEPKTAKSKRVVFVSDYILDLIRCIPHASENDYIFPLTPDVITKRFLLILRKNGLPECRFHDLRHSFASVLYSHGIDISYIQSIGGWSTDRVMKRVYIQTSQDALKTKSLEANNVFERLMQPDATTKNKKVQ